MMDEYPSWAEKFTRSDYTKYGARIPSKILPGRTHRGLEICLCPRCGVEFETEWEHGVGDQCEPCALNVLTFGNAIFVWDTTPPGPELIVGEIVE
jgi:hypothetical protein